MPDAANEAFVTTATGKGGHWLLEHTTTHVVLQFLPSEGAQACFTVEIQPETAVRLAQALVKHALRAGHGEPVTLNIGG